MKKFVASLAVGAIFAGTAVSTVSAEEYEVQEGDTLWKIAEDHDIGIEELVEINDLSNTTIHPKQTIYTDNTYEVEEGDTLSGIAGEFDVKVKDIKKWNDLDSSVITVGQELEIKGAKLKQDKSAEKAETAETAETEAEPEEEPAKEEQQEPEEPAEKEEAQAEEQSESESDSEAPEGETISVTSTAYTANCDGCSGVTATGVDLNADPNAKVIAVDPSVIPLGSKVHVEGYGTAIAADTGGAINGNKIDVHVPSDGEAMDWGVRTVNVTILD